MDDRPYLETEIVVQYLILSQGKFSQVDDEDYDWLNQWKWSYRNNGYAIRAQHVGMFNGKQKQQMIRLHRFIMSAPHGMSVDHINGDGLDNRRCNLRICTHSQNHMNSKSRNGSSSKYKGVTWLKKENKWWARIKVDGVYLSLGKFVCEEDAGLAYNVAAEKHYGQFSRSNLVAVK